MQRERTYTAASTKDRISICELISQWPEGVNFFRELSVTIDELVTIIKTGPKKLTLSHV